MENQAEGIPSTEPVREGGPPIQRSSTASTLHHNEFDDSFGSR